MPHDPAATRLYHITDVSNLPGILAAGGLRSDVGMAAAAHKAIGYSHMGTSTNPILRQAITGKREFERLKESFS